MEYRPYPYLWLYYALARQGNRCRDRSAYPKFMGLKQRLVKPLQILLPFYGKQLLFGRVALLTARYHIAPSAFATPGYRHNVIHGQFFRQAWPAAIVAHSFGQTAFPPLRSSKLPSFVTRPFQIFFVHIIGERPDGFFSFHF